MVAYSFDTIFAGSGTLAGFDPFNDTLTITGSASSVLSIADDGTDVTITQGGNSIVLTSMLAHRFTSTNILASDGSTFHIGDNNASADDTGDNADLNINLGGVSTNDFVLTFDGADTITGGSGNERLNGGNGQNRIQGAEGNDTLVTGDGFDLLTGGDGVDTFFVPEYTTSTPGDTITDFSAGGLDIIDYSDTAGPMTILTNGNTFFGSSTTVRANNGSANHTFVIEGLDISDVEETSPGSKVLTIAENSGVLWLTGARNITMTDGNDTVFAGQGNDTINGGAGSDVILGGGGFDYASFENGATNLIAILDARYTQFSAGDAAGDEFILVEGLIGSSHSDFLGGDENLNGLFGENGDDELFGLEGEDYLFGGSGDDTLNGGTGGDWLFGDDGSDTASYLVLGSGGLTASLANSGNNTGDATGDRYFSIENLEGSFGADALTGDGNANYLSGVGGRDTLVGFGGNDTLDGGARADELNGGAGFDYASYASSNTGLTAVLLSGFTNLNTGHADGDSYTSIEGLIGSSQNDLLAGDNNANELIGGGGDDELLGLNGNDTLDGGAGNDTLNGGYPFNPNGFGDDRFVFATGYDQDTITGFAAGAGSDDVIALSLGTDFDTFGEVQSAASDVGGNTLLTFNGGDSLTLIGVTSASLHNDDFVFV